MILFSLRSKVSLEKGSFFLIIVAKINATKGKSLQKQYNDDIVDLR